MAKVVIHVIKKYDLAPDQLHSLLVYYQPLFSYPAASLYLTLYEFSTLDSSVEIRELLRILQIDVREFEANRKELERFGLIRTFELDKSLSLELLEPLRPVDFMEHSTFGRLYAIVMGREKYIEACVHVQIPIIPDTAEEITAPFDIARLSTWDEQSESAFITRPVAETSRKRRFDASSFFKTLNPMIFPMQLRTREVIDVVEEFGSNYKISYADMKSKLLAATNFETMIFDKRKFQVLVDRDHGIQNVNTVSNAYELDPISFIAYKQENDYVVDADKNLIKSLQSNFKFNDEVVNILIEYILDNNNKNLNKNYVEKIAATWKRKGIETAKQAQDEVSRPITKVQSQPKARVEIQSPDYTEAIEVTQESDDENTRIIEAYLKGGQS